MMIDHKKHRKEVFALALCAAVALLVACGDPEKKSTSPATNEKAAAIVVGLDQCVTCHTTAAEEWLTSRHANLDPGGSLDDAGKPTLAETSGCSPNCHDSNGDSARLTAGYTGNTPRPVVGCETCHGAGSRHADGGGTGSISLLGRSSGNTLGSVVVSGQFVTCTVCHELLDSAGTGTTTTAVHDAGGDDPLVVAEGANTNKNSITDTHFATSGDWSGSGSSGTKDITGYAMDFADERVCTNCHNPHTTADINREWAESAHADKNAVKQTYLSGAWAHYNWSQSSRASCQRCHATTGFKAYADALREARTADAYAIMKGTTQSLTETSAWKPEMLECNGCHTDSKGTLRDPGAVTANYDVTVSSQLRALSSYTFPDIAGSNICMLCHTGRENGDSLKNLNDSSLLSQGTISSTNFSSLSFINSHYLAAGGTVFTATGYEFNGRAYEDSSYYRHADIGTEAEPGTGENGPCVGCHMSRQNGNGNHLFLPVTRSTETSGEVTAVTSEVCFICHGPSPTLILDLVKEQKEQFKEGLEAAFYVLGRRGIYFREEYPYFFSVRTASTTTDPVIETVSVATGSATVIGTGTLWTSGTTTVVAGDYFKVDNDGTYYEISSVESDTSLTLETEYTGNNGAVLNYTIISTSAVKDWRTKSGTGITRAASSDTDTTGATTGKNNMGAAFNLNLLEHDPGAYVHNRVYAKRLLYDTIDWSDDNSMNYSVGATLNALGSIPFMEKAIQYILPNGTMTGIAAERP